MTDRARMVAVFPVGGVAVDELTDLTNKLEAEFGTPLFFGHARNGRLAVFTEGHRCGCGACTELEYEDFTRLMPDEFFSAQMILCQDCGNKRCPKAANHENVCSGSNEPGQAGSSYA